MLKAKHHAASALSCTISTRDLIIPEKYTVTMVREKFLLHDSCASDNRIIIFSTERNLNFMAKCDHWYADGTLKTSPSLLTQVFIIHGVKFNNVLPTAYALLPDKSQQTYSRVIEQKRIMKLGLSPVSVLTDFENAQINAFNDSFLGIGSRECFFHFSQCI